MTQISDFTEQLPASWLVVELAEICSKITDGTHKTPDYRASGIRFISIKNIKPFKPISWEAYERFISKEEHQELSKRCNPEFDDILFPRIGTLGYAKRVDFHEEVSLFVGLGLAKPIHELVSPQYLEYWMNHPVIDQLSRDRANGSGRLTLPLEESKKLPVPLAPLREQTRIVEKLEELLSDLDAGVAELKAAQRKLAQYRQSLLKAAVEGALTTDWRAARASTSARQETGAELLQRILTERRAHWEAKQLANFAEQGKTPPAAWQSKYKEPMAPSIADLATLPDGWVWSTLDQLTEFITSGSRGWAAYYADEGATFIRSQDINKDWLDLAETAYVNPPKNSEGARTRVGLGDLLLTITGANVGKAAWVGVELEEAYVSQHVALIRPVETALCSYLHLYLTAVAGGRGQLNEEAYGAGKPGLNLQQVAAVRVPLPSNVELVRVMEEVATQLDATVTQYDVIEHALKQSAAQRKNILKAAFAGQLVPQDPNDEPASALLERIRAERVAAGAKGAHKTVRRRKEPA